jgi:hypothetical protein
MVHTRRNTYPPNGNRQSIRVALLGRSSRRVGRFPVEQLWSHVPNCSSTGGHGRGCDKYAREPKVGQPGPALRVDEHVFLGGAEGEAKRKRTKCVEVVPSSSLHEPRRANA